MKDPEDKALLVFALALLATLLALLVLSLTQGG